MRNLEVQGEELKKSGDEFSETNLYYASQDLNFKSSRTKTLYFEFDIRSAKDLSINGDNSEEMMHDLTLLNIQDITQIVKN
jgi:hypothetical protein